MCCASLGFSWRRIGLTGLGWAHALFCRVVLIPMPLHQSLLASCVPTFQWPKASHRAEFKSQSVRVLSKVYDNRYGHRERSRIGSLCQSTVICNKECELDWEQNSIHSPFIHPFSKLPWVSYISTILMS